MATIARALFWIISSLAIALVMTPRYALQVTFRYFYDDCSQLIKVVGATGLVVEYIYDPVGNIREVKRSVVTGLVTFNFHWLHSSVSPDQHGATATTSAGLSSDALNSAAAVAVSRTTRPVEAPGRGINASL